MPNTSASLNQIIDQSSNEIYIFDQNTLKFLYANNGAKLNLGYSMDELRNLTPADIKPLLTTEDFHHILSTISTKGEGITKKF